MKCASSPLQREAHKHKIFLRIWLDRPDASKGYFLNRPNSCFKEKGNSESLKPQRIRYGWNGNWGMMKKMQSSLNFRWSSIWTSSLFGSPETRSSGLIKHKSEFTPHIQDNDIVQDIYPQCKAGNYDDRPCWLQWEELFAMRRSHSRQLLSLAWPWLSHFCVPCSTPCTLLRSTWCIQHCTYIVNSTLQILLITLW